ncbi:MAG: helix-turn-helix transcriptional regulator [Candidatus Tyrphobacter sp.]
MLARTVCEQCNEAAKVRVRASRLRMAEQTALRRTLLSHENAGDFARASHAYPEALSQYQAALESGTIAPDDERRLCAKYAGVLFYGHAPERARPWIERCLASYRSAVPDPANASASAQLLLRLARQYWLEARTPAAIGLIADAIDTARSEGGGDLVGRANLQMAHYCILLGKYAQGRSLLRRGCAAGTASAPETRAVSIDQRAILFAAQGDRVRAYEHFDRAVEAAKQLPDGYLVTSTWDDYGIWAMALGDIATAQLCRERALLVARQARIAWRIPYLSLRYAALLVELEQYDAARELVLDALTYGVTTPCVQILVCAIGTNLGCLLHDEGLVRRCVSEEALEQALESGEPSRIGPAASAVARLHLTRGETREAAALAARALGQIAHADHACDLLVDVALLCDSPEREMARGLLQTRASLPNGGMAEAYLDLFDAACSPRNAEGRLSAHRAAERFSALGWLKQETFARSLGRGEAVAAPVAERSRSFRAMLGGLSSLTRREAEVAELVLKGCTNREIARDLSISEHTVESHMTSIMNRLGIRSRHQLIDMVADSGKAPVS